MNVASHVLSGSLPPKLMNTMRIVSQVRWSYFATVGRFRWEKSGTKELKWFGSINHKLWILIPRLPQYHTMAVISEIAWICDSALLDSKRVHKIRHMDRLWRRNIFLNPILFLKRMWAFIWLEFSLHFAFTCFEEGSVWRKEGELKPEKLWSFKNSLLKVFPWDGGLQELPLGVLWPVGLDEVLGVSEEEKIIMPAR